MRKFTAVLLICLFYLGPVFGLDHADEAAIHDIIQNYTHAWNDQAGKGFGEGFAADADFVNIFGTHFSGKAEIEARHIQILKSFLKNSKLHILSTKLREVQPGLVIALVRWRADGFRQPGSDLSLPGVQREGIFTQVFVKHDHQWEIAASQNTLVPNS